MFSDSPVMITKVLITAILILNLSANIVSAASLPLAEVTSSENKVQANQSRESEFWVWPLIKRGEGPQLSVVSPLDVLRQQLIYELARRRIKENREQIEENEQILRNLGKRSVKNSDDDDVSRDVSHDDAAFADELIPFSSSARNARSLPNNHHSRAPAPPQLQHQHQAASVSSSH
jgi:hypothetical protein